MMVPNLSPKPVQTGRSYNQSTVIYTLILLHTNLHTSALIRV
jgi:hypothetical protein